jgi:hypothetical protein
VSDVDTSATSGLIGNPSAAGPSREAKEEFSSAAPKEQIRAVADALERNGITSTVVDSGEEARKAVRSILPVGAEVYNNTSPRSKSSVLPKTSNNPVSTSRFAPVCTRWTAKCKVGRCVSCPLRPIGSSAAPTR